MDSLLLITIGWGVTIAVAELILWSLFRSKMVLMSFPKDSCHSALCRLHSIAFLRIFALIHTLVLIATVVFFHVLLW